MDLALWNGLLGELQKTLQSLPVCQGFCQGLNDRSLLREKGERLAVLSSVLAGDVLAIIINCLEPRETAGYKCFNK